MTSTPESQPLSVAERIDAHSDRFEAEWQAGRNPRIEDFLGTLQGSERASLFRALLAVELELLQSQGQPPEPACYHQRFPDQAEAVAEVFRGLGRPSGETGDLASGDTSISTASARTGTHPAPEQAAPPAGPLPVKIGRFEVLGLLGEGAFGKVYRARDPQLDREVAVKVPQTGTLETEQDRERFLREARSAATIRHPNICPVFEVGQDGAGDYIVMAYVPGRSLAANLDAGPEPVPVRQAALIIRKLALALDVAHGKGIIHRDLKPSNIMLDRERKDVVIMDFGLARRFRAGEALLTQSGVIMGTPAYMPPEQARGDIQAIGPWSDVYSLGVILFEMLAGQRPFTGSAGEVIGQILHVEPAPPSRHRPEVDRRLEAICLRAMAKEPAQRFRSMSEFAGALDDFLKGLTTSGPTAPIESVLARPVPHPDPVNAVLPATVLKPVRGRRWILAVAAGLALIVGGWVAAPIIIRLIHKDGSRTTIEVPSDTQVVVEKRGRAGQQPPIPPGWVPLFNGKDLTGWKAKTGDLAAWGAEEDELVARSDKEAVLVTEKSYGDFSLSLEFQLPEHGARGGVFLYTPDGRGLEINLLAAAGRTPAEVNQGRMSGALSWQHAQGQQLRPTEQAVELESADEWNQLQIDLRGLDLTVTLNGEQVQAVRLDLLTGLLKTADLTSLTTPIGLQVGRQEVRYRNVHLRTAGSPEVPLLSNIPRDPGRELKKIDLAGLLKAKRVVVESNVPPWLITGFPRAIDGDIATFARAEQNGPLVITLTFDTSVNLRTARIFPAWGSHDWTLQVGPEGWRNSIKGAPSHAWSRMDLPQVVNTRRVTLELRQIHKGEVVVGKAHVSEIELYVAEPPSPPEKEVGSTPPPGRLVFDHPLSNTDTLEKFYSYSGGTSIIVPGSGLLQTGSNSRGIAWPRPFLGDEYRVQFEVNLKGSRWAGFILNGPGYGSSPHTGYLCGFNRTSYWLEREGVKAQTGPLPRPLADGEWATVQADVKEGKIAVTVNGFPLAPFEDREPLSGPLHGWFGLTASSAHFRKLRIWSSVKDPNREPQLLPPATEKACMNGELLYELKLAGARDLGAEWWKSRPKTVAVENGAVAMSTGGNTPGSVVLSKPLSGDFACEVEFEYQIPRATKFTVMLWSAAKAPQRAQDCEAGCLVHLPYSTGRYAVQWHGGPKEATANYLGTHANRLLLTPYYVPLAKRKYLARIETKRDGIRVFMDGVFLFAARRPDSRALPVMPVFLGLREHGAVKVHAVRVYQIAAEGKAPSGN
jgi:tRNA A-37 threonylcarbamoyl transferase component Bud32